MDQELAEAQNMHSVHSFLSVGLFAQTPATAWF